MPAPRACILGRYDPNDYLDVLGYANPFTAFQNLSILLNSSIAFADASLGIGAGHYFKGGWYGLATLNDANGVVTDLEVFDHGSEFYTHVEFGWSPTRKARYTHNVHVTAWHVDQRDNAGIPESWGLTAGANWTFDETWMPFLRAGWSEGDAPLMHATITAGLIYRSVKPSDLTGMALNWGKPSDDALDDQFTIELFHRFQLAQNFAMTPSVQFLIEPALNPDDDAIVIFGLRARLTL